MKTALKILVALMVVLGQTAIRPRGDMPRANDTHRQSRVISEIDGATDSASSQTMASQLRN